MTNPFNWREYPATVAKEMAKHNPRRVTTTGGWKDNGGTIHGLSKPDLEPRRMHYFTKAVPSKPSQE